MATKKSFWVCSKCGALHDEEREAKECEQIHAFEEKMEVIEVSQCSHNWRYPDRILVSDGSGDAAEYEIRGEHSYEEFYQSKDWYFEWNGYRKKEKMINDFRGDNAFLSNFYPCEVVYEGLTFISVEHAYQAAKTLELDLRKMIQIAPTPGEAKKAGQKVPLRPGWEEGLKFDVMKELLLQKFQMPKLREKLLETENKYLEEGNWWHDNIFGNCTCMKCENVHGQNVLGKLLMEVRNELQEEE